MKLTHLLQAAKIKLKKVSPQAYQESLWILSHTVNAPASQIYLGNISISSKQEKNFWSKIQQRKQAVPLEYILKETYFLNYKFYIKKHVFIPRPETEILIKWLYKYFPKNKSLKFIDFGAGMGTIALPLLSYFTNSVGVAVELYSKAIECLKKNRDNLKLQNRLSILKKDVFNIQSKDIAHEKLFNKTAPELITANPPYIDPKDDTVQAEVYLYESPLALFSNKKGLGHIISWFKKAIQLLKPKGIYIFEFAWNQKKQITEFLNNQEKIISYKILKDQLGHSRAAICFKKDL